MQRCPDHVWSVGPLGHPSTRWVCTPAPGPCFHRQKSGAPATLNLQKTVGRNQIHRIHGFPHLGTLPKTCVRYAPPQQAQTPRWAQRGHRHQDLSDLAGLWHHQHLQGVKCLLPLPLLPGPSYTQAFSWSLSLWLLFKANV